VIRIALAKGRVSSCVLAILSQHGLSFGEGEEARKLILSEPTGAFELILVKPADTPIYVENAVADCGIVGRDILMESDPDVYRLFALDAAQCALCVAGRPGTDFRSMGHLTVASKYTKSADSYFNALNIPHTLIKLNGSVELAPILGMSDVIVDIVETGNTLRANGLAVLETICEIRPVFIVNKAALKTKYEELNALIDIIGPGAKQRSMR